MLLKSRLTEKPTINKYVEMPNMNG